jgi:hypothetical protein
MVMPVILVDSRGAAWALARESGHSLACRSKPGDLLNEGFA